MAHQDGGGHGTHAPGDGGQSARHRKNGVEVYITAEAARVRAAMNPHVQNDCPGLDKVGLNHAPSAQSRQKNIPFPGYGGKQNDRKK